MAKPDNLRVLVDLTNNVAYQDTGKASEYPKILKKGSSTLIGGSRTVVDTSARTTSKIFVTNTKTITAPLQVTTKSNGTFGVNGTDTDTFDYLIVNL